MIEPHAPSQDVRRQRLPWVLLACILALALALRVYGLGAHSLWTDEFYAMEISAGHGFKDGRFPVNTDSPLSVLLDYTRPAGLRPLAIWRQQVDDSHPPLHFILLNVWRSALGGSAEVARSLSIVFSMLTLLAIAAAMRLQAGWTPTLWAAAALALSGVQISYAQEARNYAMLLAIVYALAWLTLRARQHGLGIGTAIAMGLLMYAAPLTHYLSLGPLIAIGVYGLCTLRGSTRQRFILTASIAVILFALTWGPFLVAQFRNDIGTKMRWIGVDPTHGPVAVVKGVAIWGWNSLAIDDRTPWRIRYFSAIALLVPTILSWRDARLRPWVAILCSALFTVIAMDVREHTNRLSVTRYTVLAGPALCVALCLAADRSRWTRHLVPAVLVATCLWRLGHAYQPEHIDWRPLAAHLRDESLDGRDVLLITGDPKKGWEAQVFLLGIGHYAQWPTLEATPRIAVLTRAPSPAMWAALQDARRVVVVRKAGTSPVLPSERLRPLRSFANLAGTAELLPAPSPPGMGARELGYRSATAFYKYARVMKTHTSSISLSDP